MSGGSWLEVFRGEPERAVDDLFTGRAGAASNLRLDIPEFLYQTFPPNLPDERERLDGALSGWLDGMREDYAAQVARLGFPVYGKRLGDALIALQLLDLPQTRCRIRADVDTWLRWLLPLRLAPERDPALECRRVLTRGQPDARHTAMWLRLASDRRTEYLAVALAGLQLLPNQGDARTNQRLMLQALLRHAVSTRQEVAAARRFFNQRFAALRGLFPRSPQHWDRVLLQALDGFVESTQERMASELVRDLRDRRISVSQRPRRDRASGRGPVPLEQVNRLKSDFQGTDHQSGALARRLFDLLEQNLRYAEATGESHYFVRTLSNLGHPLLERYSLEETDLARLGLMIERALAWEPMDSYCWMLWADWFGAQGWSDAREWTLREVLRLFPDNESSRVELARLLPDRGEDWHSEEAEHWLRQAVERNPNGEHSRVELAHLLMRRGEGEHLDEAERLLRQAVERNPNGEHSRVELARLLMRRGEGEHLDEAERLLRQAVERNPNGEHSRVELAHLLMRRGEDRHLDEAERLLGQVVERNPDNEHARGGMGVLLAQRSHTAAPERLLAEFPERQPATPRSLQPLAQSGNGMDSADDGDLLGDGGDAPDHDYLTAPSRLPFWMSSPDAAVFRVSSSVPESPGARPQTAPTEQIRREARRGDALAGFYSQWLMPDETPECPPHAWAWNACLNWQESAQPERWRNLAAEFPEAARETEFLRILAASAAAASDGTIGQKPPTGVLATVPMVIPYFPPLWNSCARSWNESAKPIPTNVRSSPSQ